MSARNYQLTITAVPQRLSAALPDTTRGGTDDQACREIILSTETDCFVGAAATITTSNYGYKLFAQTNATQPLYIGPYPDGPVKLSDLWVVGTSGILHILAIPY